MKETVPTTTLAQWRNPDVETPPANTKLNLLTKYGIAQYGVFIPEFHVGWDYCLKIPDDIKAKIKQSSGEFND